MARPPVMRKAYIVHRMMHGRVDWSMATKTREIVIHIDEALRADIAAGRVISVGYSFGAIAVYLHFPGLEPKDSALVAPAPVAPAPVAPVAPAPAPVAPAPAPAPVAPAPAPAPAPVAPAPIVEAPVSVGATLERLVHYSLGCGVTLYVTQSWPDWPSSDIGALALKIEKKLSSQPSRRSWMVMAGQLKGVRDGEVLTICKHSED